MKASLDLYRRLLGNLRPYKRQVVGFVLAMLCSAALEPAFPYLLGNLVKNFQQMQQNPEMMLRIPLLIMLVFSAKGLAEYLTALMGQWIAQRVVTDLRCKVFHHQLFLPIATHQAQAGGRMLSRLTNDIPQVAQILSSAWVVIIRDSFTILGLMAYLIYTAWQLTLLILLIAPVIAWLIRLASTKMRNYSRQMQLTMAHLTGVTEEALAAIKEIKIFGTQNHEQARFADAAEALRSQSIRAERVSAANVPMVQVLAATAVSIVVYVAMRLSAQNILSLEHFFSFITAMAMLFEPIRRLTNVNNILQRGLAGAQSIYELLEMPTETDTSEDLKKSLPARASGHLKFEALHFSYPEQTTPALNNFNLEVMPGETVALVGSSGSGKTTLIHLIARFYDGQNGQITLDGTPLSHWPLVQLREQMALVGQHVVLFDDTVAANIAYCQKDVTPSALEAAARQAHAWEFISALPEGLQTRLGNNANRLSGGQRQRIALARAFFKNAPILLLDEATSALDNESEREVKDALKALRQNRTVFVVAHRLSTIQDADRIIVMEQGHIVEQGSHAQLLKNQGAYARLLASAEDISIDI